MWRTRGSSLCLLISDRKLYTYRLIEALFLQRSHSFFLKQAHWRKITWPVQTLQNFLHVKILLQIWRTTWGVAGRRHSWAVATDMLPGGLGVCLQWNMQPAAPDPTIPALHLLRSFLWFTPKGTYVLRCFLRLHHSGIFVKTTDFFDQVWDCVILCV